MEKFNYHNSQHLTKLRTFLEEAIVKKKEILEDTSLSSDKQKQSIGNLCDTINNNITQLNILIDKMYFDKFEKGDATTIDPESKFVKTELTTTDNPNDYERVYAYAFGVINPSSYFNSPKRIIVVDWEPYMLSGDLEKYRAGQIDKLGGHNQAKEFPSYDSLEAPTHRNAVNLCDCILSNLSVVDSKNDILQNHLCILEHNFFPALAFGNNKRSIASHIKKYAEWNQETLTLLLQFYDGDIVIGHRDCLGYLCSYNGLFNVAIDVNAVNPTGESTSTLLSKYPDASIIGRKIIRSWYNHNLKDYKAAVLLDEKGTIWVGYTHPVKWDKTRCVTLASWLHQICEYS